jgi:hypothetical protein
VKSRHRTLQSNLAAQVQLAVWYLARMDFKGLGPHHHDELEDQSCRHRICRFAAYDRGRPPGDCLEVRISLPEARQRDSSSTSGAPEYALSNGTFLLAERRMTSRVYSKTALGPIVEIIRNAGAAIRVWYIRNFVGVGGPAHPIIHMACAP